MSAGDWSEAIRRLEQSGAENPNNPDTYYFLALAHGAAETNLHKAWAMRRDFSKKALAIVAAGAPAAAAAWGHLVPCLEMLAMAGTYVGPAEDAEYAYRWLIRLQPQNAKHYENLSQIRADHDLEESLALMAHAQGIDPGLSRAADLDFMQALLQRKTPESKPKRLARYPTTEEMSGDLKAVIGKHLLANMKKERFIFPTTRIFALGSCFAREIAKRLQDQNYAAFFLEVSEHINSTYANRHMVDWAFGRCTGQTGERLDELFATLGLTPENLKDAWRETDVLIYTLGVAPVFCDRNTGAFIMPKSSSLNSRALAEVYRFRTTTVAENVENLEYIRAGLLSLNPGMKIVVTVSPVPLRTTFEFASALQADCVSKSTLRVVAHEFGEKHPEIVYWPSFEVVRWIGGHVGPFFGNDDGAALHVDHDVVTAITDAFIEYCS